MERSNKVFIATSLDGFIADKNGNIDWLHEIPNPENIDMGYQEFTSRIDALVMGRTTYETVLGFDIEWPYQKPVFVLSTTLSKVPENLEGKVFLIKGTLTEVLAQIHKKGYNKLYIDGGKVIQSFLKEDLIDEIILTRIPVLLGEGSPLFSSQPNKLNFECTKTQIYLDKIVQNHFKRIKE
ncbi:diacylglycerol kinase [Tenacibaculum holothuriorum]|uniref:Diacylglycerol kinase n=1 Tax=Tenacibaculum holothuriorum TaxID=1635173 RepID=A0A1Y2PE81_9FLAO|nr:dihydrofolate reductase family protein [Tenacibaculum holothuriorum]OSY88301.1 diacylglycerol kinase [Tenacibaculum holothuriorum]